jgi:hypothetical protein
MYSLSMPLIASAKRASLTVSSARRLELRPGREQAMDLELLPASMPLAGGLPPARARAQGPAMAVASWVLPADGLHALSLPEQVQEPKSGLNPARTWKIAPAPGWVSAWAQRGAAARAERGFRLPMPRTPG